MHEHSVSGACALFCKAMVQSQLDLMHAENGVAHAQSYNARAAKTILLMGSTLTRCSQVATVFQDVIVLHEPTSDQLFFVNSHLLERRCAQILSSDNHDAEPWPMFLHLLEEPTLVGTERIPMLLFPLIIISRTWYISGGVPNTIGRPSSRTLRKGREACRSPTTNYTHCIPPSGYLSLGPAGGCLIGVSGCICTSGRRSDGVPDRCRTECL